MAPTGAITAEPNFDGYLQVFRRENGEWLANGPATPVRAHIALTIDSANNAERVIVLSSKALPALTATGGRLTTEVENLRTAEPRQLKGIAGEARYQINLNNTPDAVLVVTIGAAQK